MPSGETWRLRPPRHRVERRAVSWWTAQAALVALPTPLVFAVLWLVIPPARFVFGWLTLGTVLPAVAYLAVMPRWRYRVHRWETTRDAVYTASGWLWQRWRVVPMSRVQTVESVRGPLEQLFGLSGVQVTTASASGAVRIRGLDRRTAADVVALLTGAAQATEGDAT
ncbi:PH domain-containing protein [Solihabitans fulvus]|uniref:PH domain-containing protein n=1 Tax=Solihabitans fulvus TaxID=1892852 RepID=A0A5B2XUN4_9PSEU|nr:PH domain-containing protein [Solihabitans fulvus]KAA2267023.1 PH domain-containing protein [Solihabitans fulvus]